MPDSPPPPAALTPQKRRAFRLITLVLIGAIGLWAAETALRWRQSHIDGSDSLDAGLIQPDPSLGWRLSPYWKGSHRHHDFETSYRINSLGFRADTPWPDETGSRPLTLVVGDSFTFGFGVGDEATFVHHLHRAAPGGVAFANGAVPGYSTDQQALLIEKELLPLRPRRIVLVVYLGNDLLDNPRPIPLQVRKPKPYFEVEGGQLVRRHDPVPRQTTAAPGAPGLTEAVLGEDVAQWPWRSRLELQSELFRLASLTLLPAPEPLTGLDARFQPAVRLFGLLLERIRGSTAAAGIDLTLVTLAGRSHVLQADSVSAQYQEYFRQAVLREAQARKIAIVDVAAQLRDSAATDKASWFFPHDGHLTPSGHRVVADLLIRLLPR